MPVLLKTLVISHFRLLAEEVKSVNNVLLNVIIIVQKAADSASLSAPLRLPLPANWVQRHAGAAMATIVLSSPVTLAGSEKKKTGPSRMALS